MMQTEKEQPHKRPIHAELVKLGRQTVIELVLFELSGLPAEDLEEIRSWIAREELSVSIKKLYDFIHPHLCDINLWELKKLVDADVKERIYELRAFDVDDERTKTLI